MKLAERVRTLKPSATLEINAKAAAMRAEGINVISFAAGEPDFDTPEHIKEAAIKALKEGRTKYTPASGIDELKDAVLDWVEREKGVQYEKKQVLISCGGKHGIYNMAQALLGPGDEVVIQAPYWVSYPPIVELAGARPVIVPTSQEQGFKLPLSELERALTPRTKAIILNSPSNPTGAVYERAELEAIVDLALKHGAYIVSDEIYGKILYGGVEHFSPAAAGEKAKARTILMESLSKTFSMTGWRLGYTLGPEPLIKSMANVQSQSTSNPTSFAQWGGVAALRGSQDIVGVMVREFDRRRGLIVEGLNALDGFSCFEPQGAFYVFPKVSGLFGKKWRGRELKCSLDVTSFLLEEARCAVVPGAEFGADDYVRFSYATSFENIEEGLGRIGEALARLS
ncbi:MAG: pyridoxal phosphate-dependent aminotransferase [Nitrospinota bacterium]